MYTALTIFLITWFLVNNFYIQKGCLVFAEYLILLTGWTKLIELFYELITCHKCLSLWSILLVTGDITLSLGFSLIAHIIASITL